MPFFSIWNLICHFKDIFRCHLATANNPPAVTFLLALSQHVFEFGILLAFLLDQFQRVLLLLAEPGRLSFKSVAPFAFEHPEQQLTNFPHQHLVLFPLPPHLTVELVVDFEQVADVREDQVQLVGLEDLAGAQLLVEDLVQDPQVAHVGVFCREDFWENDYKWLES